MNRIKKWKHNDLRDDMAIHKGYGFCDIPLGSVWAGQFAGNPSTQIADFLFVNPSYTQFHVSICEVKVTRADFLSDIRSGKWRGYLDHCDRFYFAVPSGLIDRSEIPPEAGLMVRGPKSWRTIIAAPTRDILVPYDTMMSMVFQRQKVKWVGREQYSPSLMEVKKAKKLLGKYVAYAFALRQEYEAQLDMAQWYKKQIETRLRKLEKETVDPDSHRMLQRQLKQIRGW